jgi:hypothetical protein
MGMPSNRVRGAFIWGGCIGFIVALTFLRQSSPVSPAQVQMIMDRRDVRRARHIGGDVFGDSIIACCCPALTGLQIYNESLAFKREQIEAAQRAAAAVPAAVGTPDHVDVPRETYTVGEPLAKMAPQQY